MSEVLHDEDTDIGDYFENDEIVNTNNTSGLKPCPFCGSEDTVRLLYNDRADVERCRNCNLSIIVPFGFIMWNYRPAEDALRERIAELETANAELESTNKVCNDALNAYDKQRSEIVKLSNDTVNKLIARAERAEQMVERLIETYGNGYIFLQLENEWKEREK